MSLVFVVGNALVYDVSLFLVKALKFALQGVLARLLPPEVREPQRQRPGLTVKDAISSSISLNQQPIVSSFTQQRHSAHASYGVTSQGAVCL